MIKAVRFRRLKKVYAMESRLQDLRILLLVKIFDPKYESNRGYYVYGVENHKLKVVILTGAY